jgi:nicotinamidase-related amidase
MKTELKQAALLVIDMQADFVRSGPLAVPGAAELAVRLAPLVDRWRASGRPVVFVRHALQGPDAGPLAELAPVRTGQVLREGSAGSQVVDELAPQPGDLVVTKRRFSAFLGTDLDLLLRSMGKTAVVIAGAATHVCCDTTARDAAQLGYDVVVLSDGTVMGDLPDVGFGPFPADLVQRVVLSILARRFGDVCTTTELLATLDQSVSGSGGSA